MSELPELPRAWRGRERLMVLILRARSKTRPEDAHAERLAALFLSCFGQRTFPTEDELREAVEEMSAAIKRQVFARGPVADDPDNRLRSVMGYLRAAVAERGRVP